jgi:hypothetical protein
VQALTARAPVFYGSDAMGIWGPALYSDDTARDLREEYRMLIGDGVDGVEATDRLLRDEASTGVEIDSVFWLVLADTQWQLGRLEPRVKDAALRVIADGSDLRRWEESPDLPRRKAVLDKLRGKLDTPPPPAKRVSKKFRETCDWGVGEVIAYRLQSGRVVLFRVVGYHTDLGGRLPICDVLDWIGTEVPSADVIAALPCRRPVALLADRGYETLGIGATSARELPKLRVTRTGIVTPPVGRADAWLFALWRMLDDALQRDFGLA